MANLGKVILVLLYYVIAFLSFGSLFTYREKGQSFSFTRSWLFGFFAYHIVFQVIAIPAMFMQLPLSVLAVIWAVVSGAVILWAAVHHGKWWWQTAMDRIRGLFGKEWILWIPILTAGATVLLASVIYVSFWDATYYVGQVSFSVYTNTINQIEPLTGDWLQVFDLKHCLATYHVNDAAICRLFGIHPLIETKTVMVAVVAWLTNVLYYRLGCRLLKNQKEAVAVFMLLTFAVNIFTYSSYTASSFFLYRTYEGKAITGNLSIPLVVGLLLKLYEEGESRGFWQQMLLVGWGSVAIASSAMFLVPATMAAGVIPYMFWKKRVSMLPKLMMVMLPSVAMIACYLLGRIGWLEIAIRR